MEAIESLKSQDYEIDNFTAFFYTVLFIYFKFWKVAGRFFLELRLHLLTVCAENKFIFQDIEPIQYKIDSADQK